MLQLVLVTLSIAATSTDSRTKAFDCKLLPTNAIAKIAAKPFADLKSNSRPMRGGVLTSCTILVGSGSAVQTINIKVNDSPRGKQQFSGMKRATLKEETSHSIAGIGDDSLWDGFSKSVVFLSGNAVISIGTEIPAVDEEKQKKIAELVLAARK